MPVAVVDTGVLIAREDTDDEHHDVASAIVREIDHGNLPTGRVTNYVVLETLNWIHSRRRHQQAVDFYETLKASAGFEVLQAPQKDYDRAVDLFRTYEELSFGDATVAAYMERTDIEFLYAFDDDFDVIDGITRFKTPSNPFV